MSAEEVVHELAVETRKLIARENRTQQQMSLLF